MRQVQGPRSANSRWLFRAALLSAVSAAFALGELRYAIWGQTAEAQVRNLSHFVQPGRGGSEKLSIEYSFTDSSDTESRSERDELPSGWKLPKGEKITIQYLPGDRGSSRLKGHRNLVPIIGFLVCLSVTLFFLLRVARQANEPVAPPRKGKRSRRTRSQQA
jgi:hypothetical protein